MRRILGTQDHYTVLGVSKSATETQIKKAYHKLALKLHPDKSKAHGADEAFKKFSKAFTVLSEADTRASYDRYGMDDEQMQNARAAGARRAYSSRDEIDPEEIFRQFFNQRGGGARGGFPGGAGGTAFHFGGGNGAQFFVNGVPVGGRRRRQAAQPGEDAEGEGQQINLPPFVQAVLQTVPPPLLVMMFFAFFMVFMQVMGAVMTVVMARMHLIMPIMWFAPDRMKIPLILSVFLLSVLGMM